ncbi:uncharacterized protein LOC144468454 [Augochlora pura]
MIDTWSVTLALCVVSVAALYYYLKRVFSYFRDRGIPQVESSLTNMMKMIFQRMTMAELVLKIYRTHPDAKYIGTYDIFKPAIMIRDVELMKSILVKNFDHFQDHRMFIADPEEPLFANNLLALKGERWKEIRTLLSPAFTSSKMKAMFKLMRECANRYGNYFATLPENARTIELKEALTRYTNDVIGTCAFGVNVDSIVDRDNQFYIYGRTAMKFGTWQIIKMFLARMSPRLSKLSGIKIFDPTISKFFKDLVATTIKTRDEQGIVRPDMIQLMMDTRGKLGPGKELTIDDMTAQAFVFFLGGFESTSVLMCFAAHEIGINPEIQKSLQEEIDEVLENNNGEATYEAINDMKYLDAVINEALRMYPALVVTDRLCTKSFELPPALPGLEPFLIEKDFAVSIPIYGVQHDPQYFENPDKFMPERFLDDPKKILNSGTFLSFGVGPRMCIGNRFALLETKVLLFNLFARCTLKPNSKTTIPIKLSKKGFQMTSEGGFWFDIEPRKVTVSSPATSVSNGSVVKRSERVATMDTWSVIFALAAVGAAIYYYLKSVYNFFRDRGIPETHFYPIIGSLWRAMCQKITFAEQVNVLYKTHPDAKYVGFFDFLTPVVMIRDPELIKSVTVKNFEHFLNHRTMQSDSSEPLFSKNLFALQGERWKEVRNLLSPAFTSSKMKAMYKLMIECATRYGDFFDAIPKEGKSLELKDTFTRYTNDVIATCAFGVNVDSMTDRKNKFYVYGREATGFGRWQSIKFFLVRSAPWFCKLFGVKLVDPVIAGFFQDLVATTIKVRDEKRIVRPDMIQLMMETRGKLGPGKELTIEDMTAQAFIFFFGGFESTSTLMCFAAYEVGVNPEIQRRLQEEIDDVLEKSNGEVTYEAVNDMKYLDAIINEALRMYPVVVAVDRACTKSFELPPALPGLKPHVVEKGQYLWIPIYGIQYDSQYFEEPTKFMPERFIDDPKKILNSGLFLSFGLGPRMCIGNRFALLETKVLLFNLFARCDLTPNSKTTIPMELSRKGFQMTAKDGFWFDIAPRKIAAPVLVSSVSNGSAVR